MGIELTPRQRREIEYHRARAARIEARPVAFGAVERPRERWWNYHWRSYAMLLDLEPRRNRRILVVGCGQGDDAIRFARLGFDVYGFDISPENIAIARQRAAWHEAAVHWTVSPAETVPYPDGFFDVIYAFDIFHHIDIERSMVELRRVARPGAVLIGKEPYTHSRLQRIRDGRLVSRLLYPRMQRYVYQSDDPYITEDERKLSEFDLAFILKGARTISLEYFSFVTGRLLPAGKVALLDKADRLLAHVLPGHLLAGNVVFAAGL